MVEESFKLTTDAPFVVPLISNVATLLLAPTKITSELETIEPPPVNLRVDAAVPLPIVVVPV